MNLPQNKKDKPGSISNAMDKALGTVQPELPNIFNMVKGLISLNKGYSKLVSSKELTERCHKIKIDLYQLIKDLCEHHNVDEGIVKGFDELIEKEK